MSAELVTHRVVRQTVEHHTTTRRTAKGGLIPREFTIYVRTCSCDRVFRSFTEAGAEWQYLQHIAPSVKRPGGQSDE